MNHALHLDPALSPRLQAVLDERDLLRGLVDGLGSPLNVVLPEQVSENVGRFRAIYRRHHLSGSIYFAHKANRSSALVRELAASEAGIDIASLAELQQGGAAGFGPGRIMATGPKNVEFLWLACRLGTTLNVDSLAELEHVALLVGKHDLPKVRVMLRLSGFEATGVRVLSRVSRFGVHVAEVDDVLTATERHRCAVDFVGVSYHLDTNGLPEKAAALEGCIKVLDESRRRGLTPRAVDIGGGFGVNYLAHAEQWDDYTSELTNAILGRREEMTWQGHGFGLRNEAGTIRGALALYQCHRPVAGAAYLDELLSRTAPSLGRPLATLLLENLYDLDIEPGRALLDQCGFTMTRVVETRTTPAGERLVRLDMNQRDLMLEDGGVLMDPIVLPGDGAEVPDRADEPFAAYLIGNLCLEADFISRRKTYFRRAPKPGDVLAFPNTAGYFMDFSADHALQQPIARKAALYRDGDAWRWCLDEEYWPTKRGQG